MPIANALRALIFLPPQEKESVRIITNAELTSANASSSAPARPIHSMNRQISGTDGVEAFRGKSSSGAAETAVLHTFSSRVTRAAAEYGSVTASTARVPTRPSSWQYNVVLV
jgi:hypothetical protein